MVHQRGARGRAARKRTAEGSNEQLDVASDKDDFFSGISGSLSNLFVNKKENSPAPASDEAAREQEAPSTSTKSPPAVPSLPDTAAGNEDAAEKPDFFKGLSSFSNLFASKGEAPTTPTETASAVQQLPEDFAPSSPTSAGSPVLEVLRKTADSGSKALKDAADAARSSSERLRASLREAGDNAGEKLSDLTGAKERARQAMEAEAQRLAEEEQKAREAGVMLMAWQAEANFGATGLGASATVLMAVLAVGALAVLASFPVHTAAGFRHSFFAPALAF